MSVEYFINLVLVIGFPMFGCFIGYQVGYYNALEKHGIDESED